MPPIDLHTERLLPLKDLPDYLAARGFGKRVAMRVVKRWVRQGCHGVCLEAVVVDRVMFTSVGAVQRWVDRQTAANGLLPVTPPAQTAPPATPVGDALTVEHETSMHLLTEHRVFPTELDRMIHSLDHPTSTLAFAAGVLFRAGLRTPEDARRAGLQGLLAIKGLGKRSKEVIRSLWGTLGNRPQTTTNREKH